ncbi:hypothetical protein ACWC4C_08360 [Streptomyces olivaceoviridis]
MRPSVTRQGVTRRDARAVRSVSHDGLVNTGSFQKNGLLTHRVHQHAARYPAGSDGLVARRALGAGDRPALTLPHRLKADDGHNALADYETRGPGGLTDHGTGHVPWTRWTRTARR